MTSARQRHSRSPGPAPTNRFGPDRFGPDRFGPDRFGPDRLVVRGSPGSDSGGNPGGEQFGCQVGRVACYRRGSDRTPATIAGLVDEPHLHMGRVLIAARARLSSPLFEHLRGRIQPEGLGGRKPGLRVIPDSASHGRSHPRSRVSEWERTKRSFLTRAMSDVLRETLDNRGRPVLRPDGIAGAPL
jgi:hypothetical protein